MQPIRQLRETVQKSSLTRNFYARLSPLSLLAAFTVVWLAVVLITGKILAGGLFVTTLYFIAVAVYCLYAHFILCNYLGSRQSLRLWLAEAILAAQVLYWLF